MTKKGRLKITVSDNALTEEKNLLHDSWFRRTLIFGDPEQYGGIKRTKEKRFLPYIGEKEEDIKCCFKKHRILPKINPNDIKKRIEVRESTETHIFIIEDGMCIDVHTFPDI